MLKVAAMTGQTYGARVSMSCGESLRLTELAMVTRCVVWNTGCEWSELMCVSAGPIFDDTTTPRSLYLSTISTLSEGPK